MQTFPTRGLAFPQTELLSSWPSMTKAEFRNAVTTVSHMQRIFSLVFCYMWQWVITDMHRQTPQLYVSVLFSINENFKSVSTFVAIFHYQFPLKKMFNWLASSGFRSAGMWSCLAGLRLADVSKEEILIFLDPTSLTNTSVTFIRNTEKNKTATFGLRTDRQTDRQTVVELEQRDTENGEKSYRSGEGNSAEEYFDIKKKKKHTKQEKW